MAKDSKKNDSKKPKKAVALVISSDEEEEEEAEVEDDDDDVLDVMDDGEGESGSNSEVDESNEENSNSGSDQEDETVPAVPAPTKGRRSKRHGSGPTGGLLGKGIREKSNLIQKVFLAHKCIGKEGWNNVETMQLTHPSTKTPALYLFHTTKDFLKLDVSIQETLENGSSHQDSFFIFEVLTMDQPTRSWFIGDNLVSDGNVYTFTPMDPLFLVAAAMSKSSQARPLLDHLEEVYPGAVCKILSNRISLKQLANISTRKVVADIEAFAYSEVKTLSWLSDKVKKVAKYLQGKEITAAESSISSNFTKCADPENSSEAVYMSYACEIVSDYIDEDLKIKLFTKLGIPIASSAKRKAIDDGLADATNKKLKTGDGTIHPLEDYGTDVKSTPQSAVKGGRNKTKEFEKAAKGTHLLSKFFQVKPKS